MQIVTPDAPRSRVGFIVPRWTTDPVHECQGVPFRAISVAGALFAAGHEIVWFDQEPDLDRVDRSQELRAALADAAAVFFWMQELDPLTQTANALRLARAVKAWYPTVPTVVGGEFIALSPPETLEVDPPFDFILRGYGEEGCPDLLRALAGEIDFAAVPGLLWRDGGVQRTTPTARNRRLQVGHLALYHRLDLTAYIHTKGGIFGNGEPTLVIGTSRGCPKRCTFCYWSTHEPSMLEADDIVDLAEALVTRYGVRQFHIGELDFATNRRRVLAMARAWRARIPQCTWFALMSPSDAVRFSDAEWDEIAAGGCRKVEFGTETGSPRMLAAIGKKHRPDDAVTLSQRLLARGIMPMHNFVFGLLGETRRDRLDSLRLIRTLQGLPNAEWIFFTFRFYQAAWGTVMGDAAIARTPDFPKSVKALLPYRTVFGDEDRHSMRWLRADEEREIKRMVYHYLPLTTSKLVFEGRGQRLLYGTLQKLARWRLRVGWFGGQWDRWLHRRLLQTRLDNTYRL